MSRRRGWGIVRRLQFIRNRPVLAAIGASALTLVLIGGVIVSTTRLRCGPLRAFVPSVLHRGCVDSGPVAARGPSPSATPFPTAPIFNPISSNFPNPFPITPANPQANLASPAGPYPPFFGPSSSATGTVIPALSLNCRLAVAAGPAGSGGFIVFPGGAFIADPTSGVSLPASAAFPAPGPGSYGYGYPYPGLSYDQQFKRWVPVGRNQVSPDGSRFAYTGTDGIYVVNVATNAEVELGEGRRWSIVAVQNDGVYASEVNAAGLWLHPFSGTPRQITATGYWRAASSTAAFGTAISAVPQGATNTILRLDLKSGSTTDWFTRPETLSSIFGLDGQGNPILSVQYLNGSGGEILIASGPTQVQPIARTQPSAFPVAINATTPAVDSHGIWFSGAVTVNGRYTPGVALFVVGSGLYWMSSVGGQIAGGCY